MGEVDTPPVSLWLVRHGQIAANRDGVWHGSTDSELTWRGRRQAKRLGKFLTRRALTFDALYCSPLQRCRHTAQLITRGMDLEPRLHEGLREMALGEWEGISFKSLHEDYDLFSQLQDPHYRPPGGESLAQVCERVLGAFGEMRAQRHRNILCVSHGVTMGIGLSQLFHNSPTQWQEYVVHNCSLTELRFLPEPVVHSFNSVSHL